MQPKNGATALNIITLSIMDIMEQCNLNVVLKGANRVFVDYFDSIFKCVFQIETNDLL